jgi:ribose transport system substrate-binding protein
MQRLLKPAQFSGDDFEPDETKYTIAVIPKGTTHEFWRSVHHGAHTAAEELGNVKIIWKGPLSEGDREGQINVVQDFITRKVDGICLAPLDARALVPVVDEAKAAGIPTVIYDSDLDDGGKLKISYVATDNFAGGALAARRIGTLLSKSTPAASDADAPVSPTAGAATTTSTAPSTDAE